MKKSIIMFLGVALAVQSGTAATQFLGGRSLFHTWTTSNLEPGQLAVQMHTRFWSSSTDLGDISNVTQAVALTFGFSPHVEIEITPMLYQDLNFSSRGFVTYNAPDDVYMRLRVSDYQVNVGEIPINWGLMGSVRTNSSKYSNVYLEPYNTVANELSLGAALSWHANQLYPGEGRSAHLNVGWLNHNDGGNTALNIFSDVTSSLEYALAFRSPGMRWEWFAEVHGSTFLAEPPPSAFTRADVLWFQPGVTWRMFRGVSLTGGLDLRLMESGPELHYLTDGPLPAGMRKEQARRSRDFPDYYPAWRFALKLAFLPSTPFRHTETFGKVTLDSQRDWEMREKLGVTEREMFDWLGAEDQSAEFLDLELEKIRAERRNAEKELERLREKLKDSKSK